VIIDAENKSETFVIGETSSLKSWAESKFPEKLPDKVILCCQEI
jgi:hypothetical protein